MGESPPRTREVPIRMGMRPERLRTSEKGTRGACYDAVNASFRVYSMAIRDTAHPKLTYEDYVLFPDDGRRHEILAGEHYVAATPYPRHQAVLGELHFWIGNFLRQNRLGRVFFAPVDVLLSKHDIVQPDLLFISNERLTVLKEKNVQGAPDLVIEVLSASTRRIDEGLKLDRYELLDVREYWTVDPTRTVVRVYRRAGDRLRKEAELTAAAGDRLTTPLIPGLEIPLAELFPLI